MADVPPGATPDDGGRWNLRAVDDLVLLSRFGSEGGTSTAVLLDPCTGDAAPGELIDAGPVGLTAVATAHGSLLYGIDDALEVFVLDRLDAPGFDAPRRIEGLPPISRVAAVPGGALLCTAEDVDAPGRPQDCWLHDGDPDRPAVAVAADITSWRVAGERLVVLDAAGALRSHDFTSGVTSGVLTPIADDVRWFMLAPGERYLLWEAGDETSSSVSRRDLRDDTDRTLLGEREPPPGHWTFNGDGTAVGFVGAEDRLAAVYRLDDGAAVTVPEHAAVSNWAHGPEFELQLADPTNHVRAYWNPFTADPPRVWFDDLHFTGALNPRREGDTIVYGVADICGNTRTMYRVDIDLGEHVLLADNVFGPFIPLADGRYLTGVGSGWDRISDLVVIDPETGSEQTIAVAVDEWLQHPDGGVFYLRATGEQAGVWGVPVPPR